MAQLPPPPPPPPLPPPLTPPPPPDRLLREALERAGGALGEDGGLRELLRHRRESLTPSLKWLLFHRPAPPLIQDGPQCGLVALWMGASLLAPQHGVELGELVRRARLLGFTLRGEMFSAADMAALAQEVFPLRAELISGGLGGGNTPRILRHLVGGLPVLVPYDEDSNHRPCLRGGHKAHWALLTGVLLGVPPTEVPPPFEEDPEIPGLFHPPPKKGGGEKGGKEGVFFEGGGDFFSGGGAPRLVLAQQGKSPRPQLWELGELGTSNAQLLELSPRRGGGRGGDGHRYVVPGGGVGEGLGGKAVLLYPPPPQENGGGPP